MVQFPRQALIVWALLTTGLATAFHPCHHEAFPRQPQKNAWNHEEGHHHSGCPAEAHHHETCACACPCHLRLDFSHSSMTWAQVSSGSVIPPLSPPLLPGFGLRVFHPPKTPLAGLFFA